MNYMVVKHAEDGMWEYHFDLNPKEGCHESYSSFYTHSGKNVVQRIYNDRELAERDCKVMNETNPCGCYAVCPVLED